MKDGIFILINSIRNLIGQQKNNYLKKNRFLYRLNEDKNILIDLIDNYDTLEKEYILDSIQELKEYFKIDVTDININLLKNILKKIDKLIEEISEDISNILYNLKEYENVLSLFNRSENTLKEPITKEQLDLIINVIRRDKKISYLDECIIMQDINILNLNALKTRDNTNKIKYQEKKNIERAKKESLRNLKKRKVENKKEAVSEELDNNQTDLSSEEKRIIEKSSMICKINRELIDNGFDKNIIDAYEVCLEEKYNPVDILNDNSDKLSVVIKEIYETLNTYKKGLNKEIIKILESYIKEYDIYRKLVDEEIKERISIEEFEEENSEALAKAKEIINRYEKMVSKLTEQEKNLLNSIPQIIVNNSSISSEENIKTINEFCSGSNINYNLFIEYDNMKRVQEAYEIYEMEESLSKKEECINNLKDIIDECVEIIQLNSMNDKNDSIDKNESSNIIMYLLDENDVSGVELFLQENKTELYKLDTRIKTAIEKFRNSSVNIISISSEPVKNNGVGKSKSYNEKVRRIRYNDIRLIYANLNSFGNIGLPNDLNNCYLIITCGAKKGNTNIYDFVNKKSTMDLIFNFFADVKAGIQLIRAKEISFEQQDEEIRNYINNLSKTTTEKFEMTSELSKKNNKHRK